MQRRENAILAGIGTTRRKFVVTKDERKKKTTESTTITTTTPPPPPTTTTIEEANNGDNEEEEEDLYVCVPVHRYTATASGRLCKGKVNHKCLFSRDDTLDVLCPDTVHMDNSNNNSNNNNSNDNNNNSRNGRATVFVHRTFKSRDILVQRNINTYMGLLCFKAAGLAEFRVVSTGHAMFGECEECVCVQPVAGTNLWIDKRLLVHTCTHTDSNSNNTTTPTTNKEKDEEGTSNDVSRSRSDDSSGWSNYTEATEEGHKDRIRTGTGEEEVGVRYESWEEECMGKEKEGSAVMGEQDNCGVYDCMPEVVSSEEWTSGAGCQVCSVSDSGNEGKCK